MSNLTSLQPLGPVKVLCEYTFIPGEPAVSSGPWAGPGTADIVRVTAVYIPGSGRESGDWVPVDYFSADWVVQVEEEILAEHLS